MGKKATKAADNVFCKARYEMAETDMRFKSREKASEALGIDRTRLANIELGKIIPYPNEVLIMSEIYNSPEICNEYCSMHCALGRQTVSPTTSSNLDRHILELLASTKDVSELRSSLIDIASDGVIDTDERNIFNDILDSLERISSNVQSLKMWAKKNIKTDE